MASPVRPARYAVALMLPALAGAALARQDEAPSPPASSANRIEASQVELPARAPGAGPGRAYLDEPGAPAQAPAPHRVLDQISRGSGSAPASQISARGDGGPGMAQLSRADLDATLAQLTPAERRVLLQAIEGTDICDDPPQVAAIVALCLNRLETRSDDFAARPERTLSAEDRLLRGDLEAGMLPTIDRVIERLARGGASSGDPSNQAIAAIALGTAGPVPSPRREEEQPERTGMGEEAQSLINALINQLGGRAP